MVVKKNFLITGAPGVGKTTLIQKLLRECRDCHTTGFYTVEIREKGVRQGFELVSLSGSRTLLSHTGLSTPHSVGKYHVDVPGLERFLDSLDLLGVGSDLVFLDEIARMECLSSKFTTLATRLLDSPKPLIGTIALQGGGLIEQAKNRADVALFELTPDNREQVFTELLAQAKRLVANGG